MKHVSLRDFQLKPSDFLVELPIVLTRFGKPIAVVNTYDDTGTMAVENGTSKSENDVVAFMEEVAKEGRIVGFCTVNSAHPFMRNVEFEVQKITYEDENGNPVLKEQWACKKCIEALENKRVGRVFVL